GLNSPFATVALGRACWSMNSRSTFTRQLAGRSGYAIVKELCDDDGEMHYEVLIEAMLDESKQHLVLRQPNGQVNIDSMLSTLRLAFDKAQCTLTNNDISAWLTKLTVQAHAVSLRDTGGIYFLTRDEMADFRVWTTTLSGCTAHRVFEVPALNSEEAIEAVLDAITRESETLLDSLTTELDNGDLGKRALRTREGRCSAMSSKLEAYAGLLGPRLDAINARLEDTRAEVVACVLAVEEEA
ncbi:unnamed protein product, partial [marine sediment metagenome]